MQAYVKYKSYNDRKANASKVKERDNLYVSQPKTNHQVSEFLFRDFLRTGQYTIKKVSPKNYFVLEIGTDKTQVLHRMRLHQFTPRKAIPDVQTTPQKRKPDPAEISKHDDLYAIAWECEYEKPTPDNDQDRPNIRNSHEIAVQFDSSNDGKSTNPETMQESSPEEFSQAE